jgi:transposase
MAWQPKNLSRQQQEERRLEGGRLLLERTMSQSQIARHLGVSPVAVAKWKQRLEAHNNKLSALAATIAHSTPSRLTSEQWQELKAVILAGAQAAGFPTERWTLPRIQQAIQQRWNVRYSTAWISIRLRELGLSVQRPQTTARKKEDALAEAWLREDWPAIKKSVTTRRRHHVRG